MTTISNSIVLACEKRRINIYPRSESDHEHDNMSWFQFDHFDFLRFMNILLNKKEPVDYRMNPGFVFTLNIRDTTPHLSDFPEVFPETKQRVNMGINVNLWLDEKMKRVVLDALNEA